MTISQGLRADAWSDESDLPLVLMTITHQDLPTPFRIVNNRENVISNGNEFIAFPFEVKLPESHQDAPPQVIVRIDNVTREIGQAIRSVETSGLVTIQVVRQDSLDTVELELSGLRLTNVRYDALSVDFTLQFEDLIREPFPAPIFSPAEFPGLIR